MTEAQKVKMRHPGMHIDHYYPHEMHARHTPTDTLFSTTMLGVPDIAPEEWTLEIVGLVNAPVQLSFDQLTALPKRTVETVFVCSGIPDKPTLALRRAANLVWGGVDLKQLLDEVGVDAKATYLWSFGSDHGLRKELEIHNYVKDIPLDRLKEGDVLLAYELNGEPLPYKHGYPVRLVVPGFYGNNSVKWLCRMELADHRSDHHYTTQIYDDPDYEADPSGKITKPVWSLPPECLMSSHADKEKVKAGPVTLSGWAWSDCPAEWVEISVDGGQSWQRATLESANGRAWQQFSRRWHPTPGVYDVRCRTGDSKGRVQPLENARNSVQSIALSVVPDLPEPS